MPVIVSLSKTRPNNVRLRSVALPTEHGGWGFISEPVLLGLLLTPTLAGFALSIAAFAAFLLRQPLKLYLKDRFSGRSVPRTDAARQFMLIYGGVGAVAGIATLLLIPSLSTLLPLLLALPLVGLQLSYDLRSSSRNLHAELAGSLAPGAVAAALALMGGWALVPAFGLWLALAVKAITAVLYVRARLRLERGTPAARGWAVMAHIIGIVVLAGAAAYAVLPWLAPTAMAVLLARAGIGLSPLRTARPAKIIGMQEVGYGLGFVLLIALGTWI